jgi:ABC-type sugar transport system substrate-binding protein
MKKGLRFQITWVAALVAAGVAGCGSALSNSAASTVKSATSAPSPKFLGDKRIGFAWASPALEVYKPIINGANAAAAARGYTILQSNNGGDPNKQLADIRTWIGQGVGSIVILALDPKATGNIALDAAKARIVICGYSDPIPGEQCLDTFNHIQGAALLGDATAKWINENLGGKAQIALLTSDKLEVGRLRIDGAMAKIKAEAPNATVVARTDAVSAADAEKAMQTILVAHPDVNVILCFADDGCLGARAAMKAAGKNPDKVFLGGWDGSLQALKDVKAGGMIKAVAALDLYAIGEAVANLPANVIEGKQPTQLNIDYVLADKNDMTTVDRLINAYK